MSEPALNRCGNCGEFDGLVNHPSWGWTCRECVRINVGEAHVVEGANASPHSVTAPSPVDVPVPVPYLEGERADLDALLDRDADVQRVEQKELPPWATPSMQQVLDHLAQCSGLLLAAGDDGTVIYAVEWAARRLGLSGKTVSIALRRLRKCGAIRLVKVLPPVPPHTAGARVYAVVARRPKLEVLEGGAE